ncbi:MAG TPA: YeeE/YedE thiosulfate transporter family protein [Candidatus Paceibacterota bacterium]|nr:YeeE/YedE thiosulfate transporter family protein [Verrucomicrobiota bacterium]HRZ47372.1 YeeE/YedE thiosulfate transporter family protein [Candidatus Paceibacterota bacterium]HRZ92212.1 YeeE/YedE thiosulfate transporter family protein [Candidatus Paceibacterota bacterium]
MSLNPTAQSMGPRPHLNPYLAGVLLGLVLLASFLTLGVGLGASAGIARAAASIQSCFMPQHVADSPYFGAWGQDPLRYYLVFMFAGTLLGGLVSAIASRRIQLQIERGPTASRTRRIALAVTGGVLAGFASRLASGCTSGQGLTGGAMLASGSLLFLAAMFAGGYAVAWFVRRQWL